MLRNLIKLQADLKCWYEVLFPLLSSQKFCLRGFWLLFRTNKKTILQLCVYVCVLTKTVSILFILDVSWSWSDIMYYYNFLCTIFSIDNFTQFSYTKLGNFYWVLGYPIKIFFKTYCTNPRSILFSERNSENCQKQPVQKFYDDNDFVWIFLPVFYLYTV